MKSYEQYLRDSVVPREIIAKFLEAAKSSGCFDPELGYTVGNSVQHDGLDDCWTITTVTSDGARTARAYADKPCRINSYGDSFTQCCQVSDGETWQEYLAGHLGEPIRNFGVGGYGVYQAYRRMLRTESSGQGASYVMLFIWGDDHMRSVMRCRYAVIYPWWNCAEGKPFHANFWSNIEMDLAARRFVERANLLPTPQSLYRMADPDFMYETLKDDLMAQLFCLQSGDVDPASIELGPLNALAEILGVPGLEAGGIGRDADRLRHAYGFAATREVLRMAGEFCRSRGKELMILLMCPTATRQLLSGEDRYDREIVEFLAREELRCFDMNEVHRRDYEAFKLSVEDYMNRYLIGHYSPAGNHLFAYSLKAQVVEWLDPKPPAYSGPPGPVIDFEGYLPETR